MANTITANYGWQMPDPGGSANTWGNTLNATTQAIDAQVFVNQQAGVPVGAMAMWASATPPANWIMCDGSSYATVGTYAALFAIVGYTFGGSGANFNVPNLTGAFPFGVGAGVALGAVGGEATHTLLLAETPSHTHTFTGVAHNHTINDPPHTHSLTQSPHNHGLSDPTHAHSLPVGPITPAGYTYQGGAGNAQATSGSTGASATGVTIAAANANVSVNAAASGVTAQATTATGTNSTVGSDGPHNNMPPFIGINFIIKFQ